MSLPTGYDRIEATFTVLNTGANDITVEGNVVSPNRSYTTTKISAVVPEISVVSLGNKTTSVKVTANGTAIPNTNNNTDRPINLGNHTAEATFTSTVDVPGFAANELVEWVNINTNKLKFGRYVDTIDYSKAKFLVSNNIMAAPLNTTVPAQANQAYTETTLAYFNTRIQSGSTVTFTKGVDGVHTLRLEATVANGANQGPVTTPATTIVPNIVTAGVQTAANAKAAEYSSAIVGSANFSTGTFEVSVATANTASVTTAASVTIQGTDSAEEIKNKVNAALTAASVPATATVLNNRIVITATLTTDAVKVAGSTVTALFGNAVVNPTPAKVVTAGVTNYTFTNDITVGQKVTVNGTTYTAGTATNGSTFNASGATLAEDLTSLAAVVSVLDNSLTATSNASVLTLTEESGYEGKVTFGSITIK